MKIFGPENLVSYLGSRVPDVMTATPDASFNILNNDPRSISFNDTFTELRISAAGIDNLNDDYNKIGLLQSFYRFIGINAIKSGYFLMHASAAVMSGKVVVFGDNGRAIGKTLSSMEIGFTSGEYMGDEFTFFDLNKREVFTDENIPIHLRPEVRKHFEEKHALPRGGDFVSSREIGMRHVGRQRLNALCYLNFVSEPSLRKIVRLDPAESERCANITLSAHTKKMLDPSLDRFQFIARSDSSGVRDVSSGVAGGNSDYYGKIEGEFNRAARVLAEGVPSYDLFVVEPCDIPKLLAEI